MSLLALALLLAPPGAAPSVDEVDAGAPRIPGYVTPAELAVKLKLPEAKRPSIIDGLTCYEPGTHLRLVTLLGEVEPQSTQRARASWRMGLVDGLERSVPYTEDLNRRLHIEAAARATAEARVASSSEQTRYVIVASASAGALVGALLSILISGLL